MKITSFIPVLMSFLLITSNCYAQPQFGVKAGVNLSNINNFEGESRSSIYAGIFVKNRLNSKWSLQPELLFSGEGTRYNVEGLERTIALHYLSLPFMLQYHPTRIFTIEAGPRIAILTDAQSKGDGGDHLNVKRSFSNGQLGVDIGIEIQCSRTLSIQGRYVLGLTDLTLYDETSNPGRIFSLGVAWQLKKISL